MSTSRGPSRIKSHRDQALEAIDTARIYKDTLEDYIETGGHPERELEAQAGIDRALAIAQVHANLEVAQAIRDAFPVGLGSVPLFTGGPLGQLTPGELDNLAPHHA